MTEKTEYQRQFGWKKLIDMVKVNVDELKMDHIYDKDLKSLEFQWLSEYRKEYGFNVLIPNHPSPAQASVLSGAEKKSEGVSTATMAIAPSLDTSAQTGSTSLAASPVSTMNTASMAVPDAHNDSSQTNSKPSLLDTASLAIPPSTTVSAQTSPVKIAGVRFGGPEIDESLSPPKKAIKKIDNSSLAIAPSTTTSQQTSPVKSDATPCISTHTNILKTVDTSAMAVPPSTTACQQTSPVKKDSSSISKTKTSGQKDKPSAPLPIPRPLSPVMAQYGQGNINPIVPNLHMKTFNVRAPLKEVYPHTLERGARISQFDQTELNPPSVSSKEPRPSLPDPSKVLKEYMKAKDIVNQVQLRFKSEYSRQFIDWTKPWSVIRREWDKGFEEEVVLKSKDEKTAGLPSGLVSTAKHPPPPVARKAWGPSQSIVKPEKSSKGGASEPVDFTRVQSIYKDLQLNRQAQTYNISSSSGVKQAEQLLARASSRASSRH